VKVHAAALTRPSCDKLHVHALGRLANTTDPTMSDHLMSACPPPHRVETHCLSSNVTAALLMTGILRAVST